MPPHFYIVLKINTINQFLTKTLVNHETFWKRIKLLYQCKNSAENVSTTSFKIDSELIKKATNEKSTITNGFNKFFITITAKLKKQSGLTNRFEKKMQKPSNSNSLPLMFYIELRKLKPKRATAMDNIPSKLVKDCASKIISPLTYIINLLLATCIFGYI